MINQLSLNEYQKGLADEKLLGIHCKKCNQFSFHSSVVCKHCGSTELETKNFEAAGTIKTYTVIRVASDGFEAPFVVALVKTDSRIHVMGNLDIDPDSVGMELIGKRVSISSKKVNPDPYAKEVTHTLKFVLE
ncbi:MAG: hypothetical protein GY714_14310 [Desulfobacterales bacterium]|nr:hypothetical protein [Desulfobacterales bacterium]MCP4159582.1 hypothetical protein [Deltaproteobacteria bacterium]